MICNLSPHHWWWFFMTCGLFCLFFFIGAEFQTCSEWNQKVLATFGFSSGGVASLLLCISPFYTSFSSISSGRCSFFSKGNASMTFSLSSKGLTHNYIHGKIHKRLNEVQQAAKTKLIYVQCVTYGNMRQDLWALWQDTRCLLMATPCVCRALISAALSWVFSLHLQVFSERIPIFLGQF